MSNEYMEMPFELAGKLIMFQATLNGKEEPFIFDSGAPCLVLNRKYEEISETNALQDVAGIVGHASGVQSACVSQLKCGELSLLEQPAVVIDISHLEAQLNVKIRGLIGYDAIKNHDVLFDYENKVVALIDPLKTEDHVKWDHFRYPLSFGNAAHLPILPISIAGEAFNMAIDCGAEMNLLDTRHSSYIHRSRTYSPKESQSLTGVGSEIMQVQFGTIDPVCVGDQIRIGAMDFLFSDISHLNAASSIIIDGLVGYELLSKRKTIVSYKRQEVLIGA